jgi:AcrR family transcriptional regulator
MREMKIPESGPKRKLLEIAEQLVVAKGFDSVSVRDITQAAEVNVAAVNYHFGSRSALLDLVMIRQVIPINDERLARLDAVDHKSSAKPALEEVLGAWLRPLLNQARKSELPNPGFDRLLGQIFARQTEDWPAVVRESMQQVTDRFLKSFAKALPMLAADELAARFHFATGGMIHLLTHPAPTLHLEAQLRRFIPFAAAGLREGTDAELPAKKSPQATFDF